MAELTPGTFSHILLSELFRWVDSGELALPELQRPAVWQDSKIPDLLDSIYQDFPIGTMLLWTPSTSDPIRSRQFSDRDGRFSSGDCAVVGSPPKHYLIDGQQRLTSLYLTFRDDLVNHRELLPIAFQVAEEEFSLVDGKIRSMLANPKEHGWYRLRQLLKMQSPELQKVQWQSELRDEEFASIFGDNGCIRRLNPERISIPVYNIGGRSYREAVEIFDRINRGTPVKQSQKVLAALSAVYPGIVGEVETYLEKSAEIHGRDFDLDFFVGTLALIARDYVETEPLTWHYDREDEDEEEDEDDTEEGSKADIQADLKLTMDSIDKALDFLDRHLGMNTLKCIPSTRTVSCLAYAIARGGVSSNGSASARQAAHWVSRSLLTGYHYDMGRFKRDVKTLRECEKGFPFKELKTDLRSYGIEREMKIQFSYANDLSAPVTRNNLLFDFMYAILRKTGAVSFPSAKPMQTARLELDADEILSNDLAPPAREPTLHQHHIYPLARLNDDLDFGDDEWLTRPWFNDIGNLTFILTEDNLTIGDASIEYLQGVDPGVRAQHMIAPANYQRGKYKSFLRDRRKMIQQALIKYMDSLTVE